MTEKMENAAAEELASLRAEVAYLRRELYERRARPGRDKRGLMEADPEAPGLMAIWRGDRGLVWQLFVQAVVSINVVLAVAGVITISAT